MTENIQYSIVQYINLKWVRTHLKHNLTHIRIQNSYKSTVAVNVAKGEMVGNWGNYFGEFNLHGEPVPVHATTVLIGLILGP